MKNYISEGKVLEYTNSSGSTISSGAVVVLASGIGVAAADIANGEKGSVYVEGVFELAKAAGAISQGDKLFWDSGNSNLTKTATGNRPAGTAFAAALSGDAKVYVKLDPTEVGQAAVVAALGTTSNLAALAVTASSLTALVPAAAALTALVPTAANQPNPPTQASVNTALDLKADNADVETLRTEIQTALDLKSDNADVETLRTEIQTKLDLKADNTDAETLRTEVEARLDAIEAKVDDILTKLKAAALMANS